MWEGGLTTPHTLLGQPCSSACTPPPHLHPAPSHTSRGDPQPLLCPLVTPLPIRSPSLSWFPRCPPLGSQAHPNDGVRHCRGLGAAISGWHSSHQCWDFSPCWAPRSPGCLVGSSEGLAPASCATHCSPGATGSRPVPWPSGPHLTTHMPTLLEPWAAGGLGVPGFGSHLSPHAYYLLLLTVPVVTGTPSPHSPGWTQDLPRSSLQMKYPKFPGTIIVGAPCPSCPYCSAQGCQPVSIGPSAFSLHYCSPKTANAF